VSKDTVAEVVTQPTGWSFPLPSNRWFANGSLIGNASGGYAAISIFVLPGDFRPGTVEDISTYCSAVSKAIKHWWRQRIAVTGIYLDIECIEAMSSSAVPTGGFSFRSLTNNQPSFLKALSVVGILPYDIPMMGITGDNVNLQALALSAWGFCWDRAPTLGVAIDNASFR
jgi:hypothetical protein